MHTMWKGSISFGLVNIPVKMFAATEDKDIKFRYIHKTCHTPIKYEKVCPGCDAEVTPDEIVRGFEYEPGRFVIIQDSDIEAIRPEVSKAIEIVDFVDLKEIDPIYFTKSYYLSPQDTGGKAYNLLREAMNQSGRIAIARIIIRDKQSLAVVRVYRNLLILETIFYPDEVRDTAMVPGIPQNAAVNEAELKMAVQLIDNLTAAFDPVKYKDNYRDNLMELIHKKVEGEEIVAKPDIEKNNIIDLMQALQASLKNSKKEKVNEEVKREAPDKIDKPVYSDEPEKTGTTGKAKRKTREKAGIR